MPSRRDEANKADNHGIRDELSTILNSFPSLKVTVDNLQQCYSICEPPSSHTHNMANSPLVIPGGKPVLDKSKLSSKADSSKDATPNPPSNNGTSSGRDLAEQMNEDEKLKYVKGIFPKYTAS